MEVPRDLADVLHYFMPDAIADKGDSQSAASSDIESLASATPWASLDSPAVQRPFTPDSKSESILPSDVDDWISNEQPSERAPLPIAAIPIGDQDIVRASFSWNLAVEIARLGGSATVVTPADGAPSRLFAFDGREESPQESIDIKAETASPELRIVYSESLFGLLSKAREVAIEKSAEADQGGVILVRIPPLWLREVSEVGDLLRWLLLFSSPMERDLCEAVGIAKLVLEHCPGTQIGATIHGARDLRDAQEAFGRLARSVEHQMGQVLTSYGLLVDDLDVYRSIVARRAIGIAHPESPAALALRDVAKTVFERARIANSV